MAYRACRRHEAEALYARQLVDHMKAEHGADSPEYAAQLNNLALIGRVNKGRYKEAERLYRQALEIDSQNHRRRASRLRHGHLNNLALGGEGAGAVWGGRDGCTVRP